MYCTYCGAKLNSETDAFCTSCGAPVADTRAVPSAAAPPPPQPVTPPYTAPVPAAVYDAELPSAARKPKKGKLALGIVAIVIVAAACAAAVWYITSDRGGDILSGGQMSAETPESTSKADKPAKPERDETPGTSSKSDVQSSAPPSYNPAKMSPTVPAASPPSAEPPSAEPPSDTPEPAVPEPVLYPAPVFDMISASGYTAATSSGTYEPELAADGQTDTAWNVPASQDTWITLSSQTEQYVSGLRILNGFTKYNAENGWVYYGNHRPKDITISFSDGSAVFWTLEDVFEEDNYIYQDISLNAPVLTTYVKITIGSVYQGDRWNDICISEIEVY